MEKYILRANNYYTLVTDDRNPMLPCFWSTDIRTYRPIIFDSREGARAYWEYLKKCNEYRGMNKKFEGGFTVNISKIVYKVVEQWEEESIE